MAPGCELGETIVTPEGTPALILHAVFNPNAFQQTILLERAWDGRRFVWQVGQIYDPSNPIYTGGGVPELFAEIDITTPNGTVIRASENKTPSGESIGGGTYRVPLTGQALTPGAFHLRARTTAGEVLTSDMTVPFFPQAVSIVSQTFDASSDTLRLAWDPVVGARAYQVMVEHVIRTWTMFTESTSVRLPGTIRHTQAEGLPAAFLPGFDQQVSIVAVDTNYYDYYRSSNHSSTGRGLANRIDGGLGVFGAAAPVIRRRLRVTTPFRYPIEGIYDFQGTPRELTGTLLRQLTVHVSAHAATSDGISGRFSANSLYPLFPLADTAGAFIGRRWKDSIEVTILSQQRLRDTIDVFKGRVTGDTIIGRYRIRDELARLVRKP
jgi:hypothetical protein